LVSADQVDEVDETSQAEMLLGGGEECVVYLA
jgi:hypothetical protein